MAIEIRHNDHDTMEYDVCGKVTLPELHVALARYNPATLPAHLMMRIDLCRANVPAAPIEVEQFIGYLENVLLPRLSSADGRVVFHANANPTENGALRLTRALAGLTRHADTLQVLPASDTSAHKGAANGTAAAPDSTNVRGEPEPLAQRVRRLLDGGVAA